jgi:hypothetical protein
VAQIQYGVDSANRPDDLAVRHASNRYTVDQITVPGLCPASSQEPDQSRQTVAMLVQEGARCLRNERIVRSVVKVGCLVKHRLCVSCKSCTRAAASGGFFSSFRQSGLNIVRQQFWTSALLREVLFK